MYWMYCVTDERKGDSGGMSRAIYIDAESQEAVSEEDARPRVGAVMQVGSLHARSMRMQDWWRTTIILEILEESENYVKFKTRNSIYEWRKDKG